MRNYIKRNRYFFRELFFPTFTGMALIASACCLVPFFFDGITKDEVTWFMGSLVLMLGSILCWCLIPEDD